MSRKISVTVEGYGRYQVDGDFVAELIAWLSQKEAIAIKEANTVREVKDDKFTGRELLNG